MLQPSHVQSAGVWNLGDPLNSVVDEVT